MSAPDILFKGIPRGNTRGYTADYLAAVKPDKVAIPCVGSFALARVAMESGVSPENIFCGDISIYSTAVGNAIQNQDWDVALKDEALERFGSDLSQYLTDPVTKGALVLYMIRVLQYDRKNQNIFLRDMQRELLVNRETYISQIKEQLLTLQKDFKGLTYVPQDMWITLDQFKDDPKNVLLVNPPRYDGGYDRMFKGVENVFTWTEPEAQMFKEKDYDRLMKLLGSAPAYSLMYYATQGEDPAPQWGDPWRSVFADKPSNKRVAAINWIVANKQPIPPKMTRTKLDEGSAEFPLFDGEIKPDSTLVALTVDRNVGDYYRDLFIHKLPGSIPYQYMVILLDGYLMSVVGLHLRDIRAASSKKKTGRRGSLTFAFTVPHEKYNKLHKLTLMSVVSRWFWEDALGHEKGSDFTTPLTVHTVMLTNHPENKTARGVLKLVERTVMKDGSYKLGYSAEIVERTRKETIEQWQSKFNR